MADSFAGVRARAEEAERRGEQDHTAVLRDMTAQERKALSLFTRTRTVAARDVAEFFGISTRTGSKLCIKWTETGFLVIADPSKKARRYRLAEKYEGIIAAETKPKRKR
jgi:transposase